VDGATLARHVSATPEFTNVTWSAYGAQWQKSTLTVEYSWGRTIVTVLDSTHPSTMYRPGARATAKRPPSEATTRAAVFRLEAWTMVTRHRQGDGDGWGAPAGPMEKTATAFP